MVVYIIIYYSWEEIPIIARMIEQLYKQWFIFAEVNVILRGFPNVEQGSSKSFKRKLNEMISSCNQ